jgi:hypothetical protein
LSFSSTTRGRGAGELLDTFYINYSSVMPVRPRIGPLKTRVTIYPCGKVVLDGPWIREAGPDFLNPNWSSLINKDPNEITDVEKGSYLSWKRDIDFYEAHMKAKEAEDEKIWGPRRGSTYKRPPASVSMLTGWYSKVLTIAGL